VNKLDAYNINLVQPITSFEDAYNQLAAMESKEAIVNDSILRMSPEEKKYSFLNSYFVFQKKASI
jgi:uncharacterized membrane protein YvbJ